ncbi:Hypothetical_protein [Hexamita inflata]|uniref:Hypothetical_protein n=1 Tax=Hexamita inflata TaxID=28002 RepID=A0AA86UY25_9EUKA|nr:Hypothetical protein HINF_LOCUS56746 [Hexamita inflata]
MITQWSKQQQMGVQLQRSNRTDFNCEFKTQLFRQLVQRCNDGLTQYSLLLALTLKYANLVFCAMKCVFLTGYNLRLNNLKRYAASNGKQCRVDRWLNRRIYIVCAKLLYYARFN